MELRADERIPGDLLSDDLRNIVFSSGLFDEHEGTTVNASRNGMSFTAENVDYSKYEIGQSLKIKIYPDNVTLKAKIIYLIKLSDNSIKFGINFTGNNSLDSFHKMLDKAK